MKKKERKINKKWDKGREDWKRQERKINKKWDEGKEDWKRNVGKTGRLSRRCFS